MPRDIARDMIRTLALAPAERRFVEDIAAQWVGVNDLLAAAAGPREPLGELLVKAGRLGPAELEAALAEQAQCGLKLGAVLVRRGCLTAPELRLALAFQNRLGGAAGRGGPLQLGNLLVAMGRITAEQLEEMLARQRESNRRLGEMLISAGYLSEPEVADGLRLQQTLRRLALAVLLATSLVPATAAAGQSHSPITLTATVLPYHSLDIVRQAPTLIIMPEDIARGYVDVPGGTHLRARSNDGKGFAMSFDSRLKLFDRVTITGLPRAVDIGPDGGEVHQPYAGRDASMQLSYRFFLASELAPGSYAWPLRISSSIVY
jgi:hypothetical protein